MDENNIDFKDVDRETLNKRLIGRSFDILRKQAMDPPFWLVLLCVFGVVWVYIYMVGHSFVTAHNSAEVNFSVEMAPFMLTESNGSSTMWEGDKGIHPMNTPDGLLAGEKVFKTNCVVCHFTQAQGLVGPNLTDNFYLHGNKFTDMVKVITHGVPIKGMISWKKLLNRQQVIEVASYVKSLQGSKPPNAKEPQGELYLPQ